MSEENGPVAFIGTDERQDGSAGIGHIGADVREILEEPEDGERKTGGFALEEKIDGAEQGDDEFTEGSSEDVDGFAEPTEEEMAPFVDDQINVVEDEEARAADEGVEKEKGVETEPGNSGEAGEGVPGAQIFFREGHELPRSRVNASTEGFWGGGWCVNDGDQPPRRVGLAEKRGQAPALQKDSPSCAARAS